MSVTTSSSATASASTSDSNATSVPPVSASQLLEGLGSEIQIFTGIPGLRRDVNARSKELYEGVTTDQYLLFRPVTEEDLTKVNNEIRAVGKGILLTHCIDIKTLIIKVPTPEHETVTATFTAELTVLCLQMGLPRKALVGIGSTTFRGTLVSKEADASFKPGFVRPGRQDWPTLVLEVGVSESLRKLRNDAKWWLSNSSGLVTIVLIFHVDRGQKTILIEKWECTPATVTAATRSNRPPAQVPTKIQDIVIDPNNIHGAPLILHFPKIFLRPPANPQEHDFIFGAQNLRGWSDDIWSSLV